MAKKRTRQNICDDHDDIHHYTNELVKLIEKNIEDKNIKDQFLKIIKELRETLGAAKYSGIRMEKRLEYYREAIEYLGFTRKTEET